MRTRLILLLVVTMIAGCGIVSAADSVETVKLCEPSAERGMSVIAALKERRSVREFSDRMLSEQDLSDLLWAAYGINSRDGRHTAASAMNRQDVDVYVVMEQGVYLYHPEGNELIPVASGDHRVLIAGRQQGFPLAPVTLLMVSDLSRFGIEDDSAARRMGDIDAALVSQNIAVFCAGVGLATVPRVSMDVPGLRKVLKLKDSQEIIINNPVGYPKDM